MDTNRKLTDITDRKPRTPSYKYSFRLNEEQHIRFNELLCKAGLEHNRSRFIVKRIFAEEFVVIRRDPSKVQFIARLNDFYFQFQKLGNNYNQIVKAINSHFSNVAIPHQIAMLEQRTRKLKIKPREKIRVCYLIFLMGEKLPKQDREKWKAGILGLLDIDDSYYKSKYKEPVSDFPSDSNQKFAKEMEHIFR